MKDWEWKLFEYIKKEKTSEGKWSSLEFNTTTVLPLTELWFPLVVTHTNSN